MMQVIAHITGRCVMVGELKEGMSKLRSER